MKVYLLFNHTEDPTRVRVYATLSAAMHGVPPGTQWEEKKILRAWYAKGLNYFIYEEAVLE